jgi:hypothetical protein
LNRLRRRSIYAREPGGGMTTFDNREKAFEDKFARDADLQFRTTARRNKLLGLWAAKQLKLTAEEADAYAKSVVQADFEEAGDEDVYRKIYGDLSARGVEVSEHQVRRAMEETMVEARRQMMEAM